MAVIHRVHVVVLVAVVSGIAPVVAESPHGGGAVAARIGDRTVTYDELDRVALVQDAARFRGLRLRDALYEARKTALDTLVADHVIAAEAARLGVAPTALAEREIAATLVAVSDADVESWFTANQARLNGATFDAVAARIRQALEDTRRNEARARFVDRLRAGTTVDVLLATPRDALAVRPTEPADGPEHAPIEIVIYSDYQCPYCARVEPTLDQVRQAYGGRIRIVYRDFPLTSIHPRAVDAAKAAHCAHEQGRFWEYHDRLFSNQRRMSDADLLQHATELGLDPTRFTTCTAGERVAAVVRDNAASGERLGVSATPAFFVNGRFMPGAQPFDAFKRVIDDELASAARAK